MANDRSLEPRLTVAIPLFRGEPWFETIVENIRRIPENTVILLSDEVSSDQAASQVARYFKGDNRIRLRLRNGTPGWREHCNALIHECETEFFSLLPQDDLIEPGYYQKLVAGLDHQPSAGIAFGTLIAVGGRYPVPTPLHHPPFPLGLAEPWMEAIELEFRWNLGIPFRGVIRREILRPIPATPGDQFADQIWMFGMALSAHLLPVAEARYHKRYHDKNTHDRWQTPSPSERKSQLITEIKSVLGKGENAERAMMRLEEKFLALSILQWRKLGIC